MAKERSASMEDYLERIAILGGDKGIVRITQLSRSMGVKKSSVTAAINKLLKLGLVKHEKYGYVELSSEGQKIALDVLNRHRILQQFLTRVLGVKEEIAFRDACEMEHSISLSNVEKLAIFIKSVLSTSEDTSNLFDGFNKHSNTDE